MEQSSETHGPALNQFIHCDYKTKIEKKSYQKSGVLMIYVWGLLQHFVVQMDHHQVKHTIKITKKRHRFMTWS
jgi:hypothetical protein